MKWTKIIQDVMSTCTPKKKTNVEFMCLWKQFLGAIVRFHPLNVVIIQVYGIWRKNGKGPPTITNFLEVLINDEHATLEKLNSLCGIKVDVFS
jgi:hypothetical protein